MSFTKPKILFIGLTLLVVLQSVFIWRLAWRDAYARWDANTVRIAVRRINNNRVAALRGTPQEAAAALEDIKLCYVPWRWSRVDLNLAEFVEEQRELAIYEIIEHLRKNSKQDLGNNLEKWIEQLKSRADKPD